MIGVSLPLKWFISEHVESILRNLKKRAVKSIELRTVRPYHTPEDIQKTMELLWDFDFQITVHGSPTSLHTAVEDVFGPLKLALQTMRQDHLTITIHPIGGDNVQMLTLLSDYAISQNYPVTLALENNRLLPDQSEGDCTEFVYNIVSEVNRDNVGICFDMGHFAYYVKKNQPDNPGYLPREEFWKLVVHTHIHALNGLKTHFPLGEYELPLKLYLEKLSRKYFGVYNIELSFSRFSDTFEPMPALEMSIAFLQQNLPLFTQLYDRTRKEFDEKFHSVLRCLDGEENGTRFGLIRSTSYLFHTNGFRWGMDISFRYAYQLAKLPDQIDELLRDLDLILITHKHKDHFEEKTIRILSRNKTLWIIPDFLEEMALSYGITPEKMIIAKPGQQISVGPLSILPFESNHYRPGTMAGTDEYGYYITADDSPSMVFPGDIRDYTLMQHPFPKADYCFAHVWLGDDSLDQKTSAQYLEAFVHYMLHFSEKNIFLAHLYEITRVDSKMWRKEHVEMVLNTFSRISPQTKITVPDWGDVFYL